MSRPEVARMPEQLAAFNKEYRQTESRLKSLYEEWERVEAEAANA
jgi:hypothetical protein